MISKIFYKDDKILVQQNLDTNMISYLIFTKLCLRYYGLFIKYFIIFIKKN